MEPSVLKFNIMEKHRFSPLACGIVFLIRMYQATFSLWLGPKCRFIPSCSAYAIEAIQKHGVWKGMALSIKRISKCHPRGGSGYDPVP